MAGSTRAEQDRLRTSLRRAGYQPAQIAARFAEQFNLRPRTAWRLAMGWPQWKLVQEFRTHNPDQPVGQNRISEWESWPMGGSQPSLAALGGLALAFGPSCTVADLVDHHDREHFSAAERQLIGDVPTSPAERRLVSASPRTSVEPPRETPGWTHGGGPRYASIPSADRHDWAAATIHAPAGRYFSGTTVAALQAPAVDDGRVVATLPPASSATRARGKSLVMATVASEDGPALYGMDAQYARRWITDPAGENRVPFPRAYEIDDLTLGVLWAASNFDDSLLDDDAALERTLQTLRVYEHLPNSTVTGASVEDLSPPSRMWLGSKFCADHIQRHSSRLTAQPDFWTKEQHGEEASSWLLFEHKLDYLRAYAGDHAASSQRTFCIPPAAVTAAQRPERILLFLAIALMESFAIRVNVISEPEYAALPGFVTDGSHRAIVANWVGTESLWHVDVPDRRPQLREFSDALGFAQERSVTAGTTSMDRMQALAAYLDLDWSWLVARCAQLGNYGAAGLIRPRSRHLSADGVDRACTFIGTFTPAAR
jgi:hypothetical protein